MNTLVITVADDTLRNLEQQAQSAGKSSAAVAAELIEDVFGSTATPDRVLDAYIPYNVDSPPAADVEPISQRKTVREYLEKAGLVVPLSDALRRMIIPGVTLEEVQQILADAGGPSLTEILDEHRGPKG